MIDWHEEERSGRETNWEAVVSVRARSHEDFNQNSGLESLHRLDFLRFLFT